MSSHKKKFPEGLFYEKPVYNQKQLIIAIGENPEKFQGILETVAQPFHTPVKGFPGGAFFPFREYIKEIAAPEPQPLAEMGPVFGYPPFPPADPPAHQQQGRGGFPDRLQDGGLFLPFKSADKTAHNAQAGEGLAYVFFGFLEYSPFAPQEINGKFPAFQDGEQVYDKIKGHVPDRGFSR
jgi:hypothetical protein